MRRWAVGLIGLLPALILAPLLVRGELPRGFDLVRFSTPLLRMTAQLFATGELPVWTDRIGMGFPLLASVQVPLLYPPAWPLFLVHDPGHWVTGFLAAHLALGAMGGIWMARAAGLSTTSSWIVGAMCGASAPMIGLTNRLEFVMPLAWVPFIYGAIIKPRLTERGAILGVALGLTFAASPQMAGAHAAVAVALHLVWRRRRTGGAAHGWVYFGVVAVPTLLPFLELFAWTDRASSGWWDRAQYSVEARQLLQAIFPSLFTGWPLGITTFAPPVPEPMMAWLASPFAGPLSTLLLVLGVSCARRFRRVAVLVLLLLVLSMASSIPGVVTLWEQPPLSLVRFPAKAWQAGWPLLALISGAGIDALRRHRRPMLMLLGAGMMCALLALYFGNQLDGAEPSTTAGHLAHALVLSSLMTLGACALALLLLRWRTAMGVLVVVETAWIATGAVQGVPLIAPEEAAIARGLLDAAGPRARTAVFTQVGNPDGWQRPSDVVERMLLEQRMGEANVLLGQSVSLLASNTGIRLRGVRVLGTALAEDLDRSCAALGCGAVIIGSAFPMSPLFSPARTWPELGLTLHLPVVPIPRASIAASLHLVTDEVALPRVLRLTSVNLLRDAVLLAPPETAGPAHGTVTVTRDEPRHVDLDVHVDAPAVVWTRDALGPGWHVRVDGEERDPVAVHDALRGVEVPAGHHLISWEHRATSLWAGLAISALCGFWLVLRRRAGPHLK